MSPPHFDRNERDFRLPVLFFFESESLELEPTPLFVLFDVEYVVELIHEQHLLNEQIPPFQFFEIIT